MINKTIHYCWFGKGEKTPLIKKCIKSWSSAFPDATIIEWNEENFDVTQNKYCLEAYENKKWAFVSDYARFKILYDNGGIYVDTDVEFLRPIDDLLECSILCGFSHDKKIAPGLIFGSSAHHPLVKEILNSYENDSFSKQLKEGNILNVVSRCTPIIEDFGIILNGKYQNNNGISVYPATFFDPKNCSTWKTKITAETRTIHHYDGSWFSDEDKYFQKQYKKLIKVFGPKKAGLVSKFLTVKRFYGFKRAYSEYKKWKKK